MKYYGMRRTKRGMKKMALLSLLLCMLMVFGTTAQCAYATEDAVQEAVTDTTEQEKASETAQQEKEPAFTPKEGFVFFICCAFSVILCVVIGIWGNPNDRLKDRYKRERKRQEMEAKKRIEREKREAKFAEEDARYAKELAEYEAAMKAKEEAKAAKKAEKAAKKAEKK